MRHARPRKARTITSTVSMSCSWGRLCCRQCPAGRERGRWPGSRQHRQNAPKRHQPHRRRGLAAIGYFEFDATKREELAKAIAGLNDMRKRADAAMEMPKSQRDQQLIKDFVPAVSAIVARALILWEVTLQRSTTDDPVAKELGVVKLLAWSALRDIFQDTNARTSQPLLRRERPDSYRQGHRQQHDPCARRHDLETARGHFWSRTERSSGDRRRGCPAPNSSCPRQASLFWRIPRFG